ncbi:hypothetical protein [Corynebacterium comes]|uniref:Uncharacterized protein n=1 Tax=Corynebacterium comes TaxID=2675218 RepID=A0A6B8VIH5_9CORY|nr:hypothetical protein [Corynebacterium comes]QGU03893.1 hypothetical protein CETAM_03065 [Corynebacterium comes]
MNPATIDDIRWLRQRRRTATTESEQTAVRARMMEVAAYVEQRDEPNPLLLALIGAAVIVAGLVAGYLVHLLADAMWMWLNS